MEHEMQKMTTFEELERQVLEQMKFAFKASDELIRRMDGAPTLNGFSKLHTSLPKSEPFFITKSPWRRL